MTLDSIRASVTLDPIRETNVWQKLFRLLPRYDAAFVRRFVKPTSSKPHKVQRHAAALIFYV